MTFRIRIEAFLSDGCVPDFSKDNIAEMKLDVRARVKDDSSNETIENVYYSFIIKPDIQKPDLWMAFDPGTTGSCAAFAFGGHPSEKDNIQIALNKQEHVSGINQSEDTTEFTPVFQSRIRIPNSSKIFRGVSIENLEEGSGRDFYFGTRAAQQQWGRNSYQSIKKLLGYDSPMPVYNERTGQKVFVQGRDLAHLLVKGLYSQVKDYIADPGNIRVDRSLREAFVNDSGQFNPSRAIVAVPNNYTILKIQDMVDTVKRLGKFKEVHYVYEAEAVFMNYLKENWASLPLLSPDNIYVVYDMGGATINATAFKLNDVVLDQSGNDIASFEVQTVSRIGYAVGGDDIDYAFIKMLYQMPSIIKAFKKNCADESEINEKIEANIALNKFKLIDFVRRIKVDWVEKSIGRPSPGNVTNSFDDLRIFINAWIEKLQGFPSVDVENENLKILDADYLKCQLETHSIMEEWVFSKVRDAVEELLAGIESNSKEIILISSGRSVLYPGIIHNVNTAISSSGFVLKEEWNGFKTRDGLLDDSKLKTAVSIGACWYALFRNRIKMARNIVTSSFGIIDSIQMKLKYVPIILKNSKFEINGRIAQSLGHPASCTNLQFVQMLGSNFDSIYSDGGIKIPHKMNVLDVIQSADINAHIEDVTLKLDEVGNFSYEVKTDTDNIITPETNPNSRLGSSAVRTEIADENSPAYIYAAIAPVTTTSNDASVNTPATQSEGSTETSPVSTSPRTTRRF